MIQKEKEYRRRRYIEKNISAPRKSKGLFFSLPLFLCGFMFGYLVCDDGDCKPQFQVVSDGLAD